MNYDEILNRCLEKMPSTLDIREGSFIYTALAPLCYELAQVYFEMTNMLDLAFLDSAYGEYLDKAVSIIGIERNSAVKCQKLAQIVTSSNVIGQKFSCDEYIFEVIELISTNIYIIEATEYGTDYNSIFGELYSILNLTWITSSEITENYILACDIEDDESLRERAKAQILTKAFGGNVPDYEEKALEMSGVSYVHVFTGNDLGFGKVHLTILGSEKTALSDQICQNCLDLFNGTDTEVGIAPIGHTVTVGTCETASIDISAEISIESGATSSVVIANAKAKLQEYIDDLDISNATVSRMKMMAYLLQIDEILDVEEFLIENLSSNYTLSKTSSNFEIASINTITIEIV